MMQYMSFEAAQQLLDRLNADEDAYPLGYEADGFQLEGWEFQYQGSGVWTARYYDRLTHGWFDLA